MENPKQKHLHHGHRERKREQFLKSGIEHLPDHEPLEFLLYYAIPRGDTNLIAHLLVKKFGSLAGVMNADYNELMKVEGIGKNAATLICFARMFSKLYVKKQAQEELETLHSSDHLKEFCAALFIGAVEEEFHCLYLTDDLKLIGHEKICSGKLGEVNIPFRKISHSILNKNCSRLVIAHNHPAGSCIPSRVDVDSTKSIRKIYMSMEVELVDHVVVGRDGVTSMRETGFMEF
ncbi:MAG: DNA repair protein RadC [Oscillospiraceae bacterium]|nr:DNA repair protein RadC [Oscillospiraceae bacterium]